ncbi:D-alanyl-D-alanine carboxypeptidase/D-alanyl-D-alanine-endopeptidase [Flexivirga oryzae]|uniref:D-alanyl-D-alanine carboxypeptidase/D-alanyl-D-alanine-endopeptidase (Penicillin-binding protein 4) n=1 Tax=Flexivirga oryzae TaxID=1794944 RepID=A0A839NE59_9MICO|nr:D-alanyl-D-alanine carboxypeptidase [Flexivirga oryzae]MBB2892971.1 D-alanyl-D-alanine carboxypeptidase/D-alanyl-D-alanine-endopeptidase (penicillin-binding protein 4) [Flexivirga oryzae]
MSKRVAAVAAAVVVLAVGYETLDVYDVLPGPLTRAAAAAQPVPVPGKTSVGPSVPPPTPATATRLQAADGPQQVAAKVRARVAADMKAPYLAKKLAVRVVDGQTGAVLVQQNADKAMIPASTTKLLSAWAVANTMDLDKPLTTKVVTGASAGRIVLVAGGDTALNPGKGDPDQVNGHAGLADLARQVAKALKKSGQTKVTVGVDTSYAPGPLTAKHWDPGVVAAGYTARIAQLGLSTERATDPAHPLTSDPVGSTQAAFVKDLAAQGITAKVGGNVTAKDSASELGHVESAPLLDVLGDALQRSDNAMIESLARQAAFSKGVGGSTADVTDFVEKTLRQAGFNLAGVHLADVCGLSDGTTIPARVLSDVVLSGTSGKNKPFADVLTRLSVGGYNGTLDNRFLQPTNISAAGDVRAKTGSLTDVASLAGTVLTADNRVLVFAVISNAATSWGPYGTRAAIDDFVADLQKCGCSK